MNPCPHHSVFPKLDHTPIFSCFEVAILEVGPLHAGNFPLNFYMSET